MCDVICGHDWFRAQWAVALLSTRFGIRMGYGPSAETMWYDYPPLTDTQAALLTHEVVDILVAADEPFDLKRVVLEELPETGFVAAGTLLKMVKSELSALAEPLPDQEALAELVTVAEEQLAAGAGQ